MPAGAVLVVMVQLGEGGSAVGVGERRNGLAQAVVGIVRVVCAVRAGVVITMRVSAGMVAVLVMSRVLAVIHRSWIGVAMAVICIVRLLCMIAMGMIVAMVAVLAVMRRGWIAMVRAVIRIEHVAGMIAMLMIMAIRSPVIVRHMAMMAGLLPGIARLHRCRQHRGQGQPQQRPGRAHSSTRTSRNMPDSM
ncbi:MAG: hypothetical protein M0Q42_12565 [Xanthomonadales bacterium]|nr:hypothetical protein [Xanthomonadales bacterium]